MLPRRAQALTSVPSIIYSTIPDFLAPCLVNAPPLRRPFHPSQHHLRDLSRNRGVSPLRRTGPRKILSISKEPLPKPLLDPEKRTKVETDENHPLWAFFNKDKKVPTTPQEHFEYGRPWTVEECRRKSWEDLHKLWWICAKERNRIATSEGERKRMRLGRGDGEAKERNEAIIRTQRSIKTALTERWYAWEHARQLAMQDPSVDLSGDDAAYQPDREATIEELEDVEETQNSDGTVRV